MGSSPPRAADLPAYARTLIRIKARQLSRKPGFSRSDEEDLQQELALQVARKWDQFDAGRASLNTFVARVVDSAIAMILRDRMRKKRAPGFTTMSLDAPVGRKDDGTLVLRDLVDEKDFDRRLGKDSGYDINAESALAVAEAFHSLPPQLQDLCRRLMNDSAAAVARDMGVSRHWMRTEMRRVRQHFERNGLGSPRESADTSHAVGISNGQPARNATAGDVP